MCVAIAGIREEGRHEGRLEGRLSGRSEVTALIRELREQGREEDIDRVLVDAAYRDRLIEELYVQPKAQRE